MVEREENNRRQEGNRRQDGNRRQEGKQRQEAKMTVEETKIPCPNYTDSLYHPARTLQTIFTSKRDITHGRDLTAR
jgi:hypothetical protein